MEKLLANSSATGLEFKRIQFTPDLQPADITGIYFYNQRGWVSVPSRTGLYQYLWQTKSTVLSPDPKQPSEAMEEQQSASKGHFRLASPFSYRYPESLELEGTFPLPEAQLDRFLMKIEMGYPEAAEEVEILERFKQRDPMQELQPVLDGGALASLQEEAARVRMDKDLMKYIAELARATRENRHLRLGLSPRGSLALMRGSLAYAYLQGRDYVLPDDIKYLFPYVAGHRLILDYGSVHSESGKGELIQEILSQVPVPTEDDLHG